jgi:hypothetical protein
MSQNLNATFAALPADKIRDACNKFVMTRHAKIDQLKGELLSRMMQQASLRLLRSTTNREGSCCCYS